MKTPSPTKLTAGYKSPVRSSPRCSPTSPEKIRPPLSPLCAKNMPPKFNSSAYDNPLAVMGHSMVSRGGDPDGDLTGMNIDLRLITGRMAQTLHSYEGKASKLADDEIRAVESQLDDIDNPILKVQIKNILSNYKHLAQEREQILQNLDAWFDHCSDEFLEELEEFETHFVGEDSLSDHITQAKDIISKIKFINSKIADFQNNGLSTEKLVAQKKTLEEELMKKKIIVDNTQTGSDGLLYWQDNVKKIVGMIKESGASDIEKALLDMKMSETGEHVSAQLINLERTSRRVGVLFKNVKELEYNNGQLAEENSFLKQQLSKFDKNYKNQLHKKLAKLDNALEELDDVKYLKTDGKGSNGDGVTRGLMNGGVPFGMEMIENYQDQVHTLNNENKDLISKIESLEEQVDHYKEEMKALEAKLQKSLAANETMKESAIVAEHPLVKFDRGQTQDDQYSIGSISNINLSDSKSSYVQPVSRRNTIATAKRGGRNSMVSTITIQDGTELEGLKTDNDILRTQVQKLKISLKTSRKRSVNLRKISKNTQTKMMWNNTDGKNDGGFVEEPSSAEEEESSSEEEEEEEEEVPVKKEKVPRKPKAPRKKQTMKNKEESPRAGLAEGPSDIYLEEEEEEEEDDEHNQETLADTDETKEDKPQGVEALLKNQERQRRLSQKLKALGAETAAKKPGTVDPPKPVQKLETDEETDEEFEEEFVQKDQPKPVKQKKKSIIKKPKKKKKFSEVSKPEETKPSVKFVEPVDSEDFDAPTFERVPTPKVVTNDAIVTLEKIKEELKEFLSYGQKFISSIHQCIVDAADDDLAVKMDNYSELEQKITGLDTSLNILLYGIDLGMFLVTPNQARPVHSPLPFENKLYFQENLSKYLREKYPKLNVNAMKLFDPDLDAMTPLHPVAPPGHSRKSPDFKPYPTQQQQQEYIDHFMLPLTTTPEPKVRKIPRKIYKRKPIKREIAIGKIEEIMASLTSGAMFGKKDEQDDNKILDQRSFAEIVDHVMPKEMAMEYLKLIQPTHDTLGKKQYNEKLKRGVMKVKDLLDLMNLSNQGVLKGLPSNKLGEPRNRMRQTKVNHTNLTASDLIGHSSPQQNGIKSKETSYKNRLTRHDRVQASLDDYNYYQEAAEGRDELRSSGSLTVVELPLTPKTAGQDRRTERSETKTDVKEDLFDLSKSNPNMGQIFATNDKRSLLPVVTQKLSPHSEAKNFPARKVAKKPRKSANQNPNAIDQTPPQVSDILNLEWEKSKVSSLGKLPKISATGEMTDQTYS